MNLNPHQDPDLRTHSNYEKVNHPKHYNSHPSGVECLAIIRHMNHNCGAAIKYIWRNGIKPGESAVHDLKKALFYIQDEINRLEDLLPKPAEPRKEPNCKYMETDDPNLFAMPCPKCTTGPCAYAHMPDPQSREGVKKK